MQISVLWKMAMGAAELWEVAEERWAVGMQGQYVHAFLLQLHMPIHVDG
jgi:hypothetical protein